MLAAEYLLDVGKKTADTLKDYLKDNDGWTVVKKTDEILIESKPSNCDGFDHGYLYRGQCEYGCSRDIIFKYVDSKHGDSLRTKWDVDTKEIQLIKDITPFCRILRTYTNSAVMGLISPRDFVDLVYVDNTEDALISCCNSIEWEATPPVAKYVRGHNHPCGFICLNVPGKSTKTTRLITFIQSDIGGSLPSSLVNSAIPNTMVGFFKNLKKILKKDGHLS